MSIIFGPDAFVVGADTNIDAYPSGSPDYAYSRGSGANLLVNAANDRVQQNTGFDTSLVARCIDAAVSASMGDQQASGDVIIGSSTNFQTAAFAVRYSTTTRGYFGAHSGADANEVQIWEDNVTEAMLASADRGVASTGTFPVSMKAVGPAGGTLLTLVVNGTTALTFNDTTAAATGAPGFYLYIFSAGTAPAIDNFVVDDLVVAGGGPLPPFRHRIQHMSVPHPAPRNRPWTSFICPLMQNHVGLYPAMEDVRNGQAGSFPCTWTIQQYPRRVAVGICDPSPVQLAAIHRHPLIRTGGNAIASFARANGLAVAIPATAPVGVLVDSLSQQLRPGRTISHILREIRVNFPPVNIQWPMAA